MVGAGRIAQRIRVLLIASLASGFAMASTPMSRKDAAQAGGFEIADYFRLQRVSELALSSDGEWLAYIVEGQSLEKNARTREVRIRPLTGPESVAPESVADASAIAWIPGTHQLAFLSDRERVTQVFSFDVQTKELQKHTASDLPVESFLFAPDGASIAYLARQTSSPGASLYTRFREDNTGIVIDPATTSSHDFVNPNWHGQVRRSNPTLWLRRSGKPAVRIPVPGDPSDNDGAYHWSSDSRWLSVTYLATGLPAAQLRDERTSLGVYAPGAGAFRVLAEATPREGQKFGESFAGGEWIPGKRRMLVRRVKESDPWVSWDFPEWTVADPFAELPRDSSRWHATEIYPSGLRFTAIDDSKVLVENTVQGVHSLFALLPGGLRPAEVVSTLDGSSSLVRFSADAKAAVFVNESLTRPPEIYAWREGQPPRRISDLNRSIAAKVHFRAREVRWSAADGQTIQGWLLEPPASAGSRPWPLLTHVHGGPDFPYPNAFQAYFHYWPYALEVLAEQGIAVFLPNYRGTHTFGKVIAQAQGNEPVEDIVAGIDRLIADGVADPERLALSGHSHGAVVGPQVMARAKRFRAAAFAEGSANSVVMYELMSEQANREIHDPLMGVSLYEAPQRYIDDSPDLHFSGVPTATLFEGGAYTAAIHMLGYPKAARRAGMPTKFIIYPKTQHNIALPNLQRESASRSLEWFRCWLTDLDRRDHGALRPIRDQAPICGVTD